jgi:hypothetical protein
LDIAVELLKSLGPAGATAFVLYLWVKSERSRADGEAEERKNMTERALTAVEKSATMQEATLNTMKGHTSLLERIDENTKPPAPSRRGR